MILVSGISLIILGIITVPTFFLPNKWINRILPYRNFWGVFCTILGIIELFFCFTNLNLLNSNIIIWILLFICAICKINLGVVSAINLIRIKNQKTITESKNYVDLIQFKTTMGIIAIGLGLCEIIAFIVW